jgi:DNA-binding response OmpR family regulator
MEGAFSGYPSPSMPGKLSPRRYTVIRVLIVDDEEQLVEAFKKKLSREGFTVSVASTARDALSLVKKQTFDVCVLDIRLPDMDGVELLESIKKSEPAL